MKRYILFGILAISSIGCKVISTPEAKSVQTLTRAMITSSTMPSDYTRQYYDIFLNSSQLAASVIIKPTGKIQRLNELLQDQLEAEKIVKGYSSGYGVLAKYAELLSVLINDTTYQKELSKQKNDFIISLDTLLSNYNTYNPSNKIPVNSLGGLVANIIQEFGSKRIRYLQRKYLKDLVTEADAIVAHLCDQYNSFDLYKNNKQLASLGKTVDENYKIFLNFLNLGKDSSNPYSYYKIYDPIYLDWKRKVYILTELNDKNSKSLLNIKTSHHKLKELLEKKSSINELVASIKDLYTSVSLLKESYQRFEKDLTIKK